METQNIEETNVDVNGISFKVKTLYYKKDNCIIAFVPKLDGCFADGSTKEEALSNIKEAISLYLETMNQYSMNLDDMEESDWLAVLEKD